MASLLNPSRPPAFCPGCSHEQSLHALDRALLDLGMQFDQPCHPFFSKTDGLDLWLSPARLIGNIIFEQYCIVCGCFHWC